MKKMKIIAVIPAHMASIRFPNKILFPFFDLPMIEHVRRRALLSSLIDEVYVATCDKEIESSIKSYGGKVIITSNSHQNGTSRIAEAVENIDCSHVILLQGDEPLLLPRHIDSLVNEIILNKDGDSWNATGPIESSDELDKHSFVKCSINENNRILYCFRRSPSYSNTQDQSLYIRKILGLIAFKKSFLLEITKKNPTRIESLEFIEQMRIIENGYSMTSVPVSPSLPSVNEPDEANIVIDYIKNNKEQKELLNKILDTKSLL